MATWFERNKEEVSKIALFFEDYVFPVIFVFYIYIDVTLIYLNRFSIWRDFSDMLMGVADINEIEYFLNFNICLVSIFFYLSTVLGLLIRKKTPQRFDHPHELWIPFVATFFYLFYNVLVFVPTEVNIYLAPVTLFPGLNILGLALILIGTLISAIGIYNLRNSFAIFMEGRDIVSTGLYRFSRHPIYLGHVIRLIGMCVMNLFLLYVILTVISIGLALVRTVLEERKLLKLYPEYRSYKKKTPSFLLRLFFLDRTI
ncbi:MAG: methyltransferase [Candidatus Omnitrophica bacterium]|nr:methyltransferase [Candidatus Omnitrophota bacterium]